MAQSVERVLGKDEVPGSNPGISSKTKTPTRWVFLFYSLFRIEPGFKFGYTPLRSVAFVASLLLVYCALWRTRHSPCHFYEMSILVNICLRKPLQASFRFAILAAEGSVGMSASLVGRA